MRILHTSDWHIGHALYAKKRLSEHEQFLSWLSGQIREKDIGALVVSGDVFDTGAPGGQAQRLYYDFLTSLLGTGCRTVVIVAGNHDSPSMLEAPARVLERLHIHIIGLPAEPQRHVIPLCGKGGETEAICCAVPYLRKNELVRPDEEEIAGDDRIAYATAQFYRGVAQEAVRLKENGAGDVPVMATGHLFVQGAARLEGDGTRDLYVGSLGQVGIDVFPDIFRYIALGHIHSEQSVGGNAHIRYCGSPLPMSFSEIDRKKYVLMIDTQNGFMAEKIEVPVFQRLKTVRGDYDAVMRGLKAIADEDVWVEVTYTGGDIRPGLSADVYDTVKGGRAEVLSIKNASVFNSILESAGDMDTLETMKVQDVFIKCLGNNTFDDVQYKELVDCFDEIVAEIEGKETCE